MKQSRIQQITFIAMTTALGIVLGYVEYLLPIPIGIPGVKLGLANLVVVFTLYRMSIPTALSVSLLRICLCGLLFGNAVSFLYSLLGGMVSFAVMLLLKKLTNLSITSVSMFGGITHNITQLLVAAWIFENLRLAYYFPVLLIAGTLTGFCIGLCATALVYRIKKSADK